VRALRRFLVPTLVFMLALAARVPRLAADEIPEAKRARGRRETVLAGIDLARRKLADVEKLYGPPDHVDKTPTPPGYAETEYVWEQAGRNRLAVRTRSEGSGPERLVEIDVWGEKATGGLGRTGRGLALGGTRRRVEQVYGRRYEVLRPADQGRLALWFAWDEDFSLNLDFDEHQRINHIQVVRNEDD
jgi:hypothetical protein